ncbi:MAG: excinuclease ABC subunit C [Candidatus Doudnabacteria bacterium CG10_big_fil_rev_8_21_14_0_10_42_18]|uniref:Excinuclease ABC subunit C n=1 Tax=Candidatus Doudnabacteria bacterium CG10_big_fil_rev_8_21_14_0_10_42_18 TaxID=1974552 RepID=A0A2H0VB62_9BACT|nr:MAG: excinuclease ABC subunit C [Candidatus Doudnabacteria bacterium CG10_big_fil_rev_8_21_14_0_10_42_18]
MIYTYLLKNLSDKSYYVGIAETPEDRLVQHNQGKSNYTQSKRPWTLVYKKPHKDYQEARKHELWLKKKNRQYKDKLAG